MTFHVQGQGYHWAVFANGAVASKFFTSHWKAEDAMKILEAKAKIKIRKCMCCRIQFESSGSGHRMCMDCRKLTEGVR